MPAEGRFTVDWPLTFCRNYTRAPNPPIVPGFGFITTVATVSECLDLRTPSDPPLSTLRRNLFVAEELTICAWKGQRDAITTAVDNQAHG